MELKTELLLKPPHTLVDATRWSTSGMAFILAFAFILFCLCCTFGFCGCVSLKRLNVKETRVFHVSLSKQTNLIKRRRVFACRRCLHAACCMLHVACHAKESPSPFCSCSFFRLDPFRSRDSIGVVFKMSLIICCLLQLPFLSSSTSTSTLTLTSSSSWESAHKRVLLFWFHCFKIGLVPQGLIAVVCPVFMWHNTEKWLKYS